MTTQAILNHQEIARLLPHSGKMCLLQQVIQTDEQSLTALASSHLEKDNPLRIDGKISSINGIEYAAQAMAVHGSLRCGTIASGYIATVRNIQLHRPYLPEATAPLQIKVQQLMSNDNGFTYEFSLSSQQQAVISGKITVFLNQTS